MPGLDRPPQTRAESAAAVHRRHVKYTGSDLPVVRPAADGWTRSHGLRSYHAQPLLFAPPAASYSAQLTDQDQTGIDLMSMSIPLVGV
ncbi:hypothetical protein KIH86_13460 [Paenibacillus sp. HN-1]|uniref:hypothetical protein n=1 Tax=Paenibacillus TaxID=44249 RepID=UPI001CA89283|nr:MULTISPECIES: hypothetical protein [Paenibacillus]MBY9080773.1 hypothetical protein [Paenibacillus sp. CGMCC 1.18879]MBY9085235.1 hypothetical protein [Paenibacillus sinensis]